VPPEVFGNVVIAQIMDDQVAEDLPMKPSHFSRSGQDAALRARGGKKGTQGGLVQRIVAIQMAAIREGDAALPADSRHQVKQGRMPSASHAIDGRAVTVAQF
jgi:hypothetical protein